MSDNLKKEIPDTKASAIKRRLAKAKGKTKPKPKTVNEIANDGGDDEHDYR